MSMGEDSILHSLQFHLHIRIFAEHQWREILTSSWPSLSLEKLASHPESSSLFPQTLVGKWPIYCMAKISMWSMSQDTNLLRETMGQLKFWEQITGRTWQWLLWSLIPPWQDRGEQPVQNDAAVSQMTYPRNVARHSRATCWSGLPTGYYREVLPDSEISWIPNWWNFPKEHLQKQMEDCVFFCF